MVILHGRPGPGVRPRRPRDGSGGEGYSFDRGGQGQWLSGTPSIGEDITLHFGGNPGDALSVFAGFALLATPLHDPGAFTGDLYLDTGAFFLGPFFLGAVPVGGTQSLSATIPVNPAAVGINVYTQSIRTGSEKVIDNVLTLALTP